MGTFTSPVALMQRQQRRFAGAALSMQQAQHELAKGGQADFLALTIGTLSEKQLRAMGHPYGRTARVIRTDKLNGFVGLNENRIRKNGTLGQNSSLQQVKGQSVQLLPINRQTGRLRRGIALMQRMTGGNPSYDLFSGVPHAKYVLALDGTKHMKARGLLGPRGLLRRRYRARHAGTIDAVRRYMRKP